MRSIKRMILGTAFLVLALICGVLELVSGWLGFATFGVLLVVGIYLCIDGYLTNDA